MIQLDLLASIACFSLIAYFYVRSKSSHLPLPPGPKKLPLIGNLLDLPSSLAWITYHKWCKDLNTDIIHLSVAGTSIIVLDTAEAAMELLERRSSLYSSRPRFTMLTELMGWDYNFAFMKYGERWRQSRRLMDQSFHPTAITRFRPREVKATNELLHRLLDEPNDLMDHIRHMTGDIIMSIVYGIKVLPKGDPYIASSEKGVETIAAGALPGAFLVDTIPALKYVPEWMPFAGFKRKAREWREIALMAADMPFEATKRNIADGTAVSSFVSYCLEQVGTNQDSSYQETVIRDTAAIVYIAGADTTVAVIASCILGLLTNPLALKKAQQEMDLVLGVDQLPSFDDKDSLPYTMAIVKEALRWRDVAPLAIPHFNEVEDVYKGYRIPAGSIIIPNSWAMLHDETIYPDPFEFNPDRFMKDGHCNDDVKDPAHATFGFGRRQCPGRHMAQESVWLAVSSIIAAFDISKSVDENGNVIEPTHEYLQSLICMPLPFTCSIKPRSKEMERLIRASLHN